MIYEDGSASIEYICSRSYVKYDTLKNIIPRAYHGSKATKLNIFIDLNSVLHSFFRPPRNKGGNGFKRIIISDPCILSSMIINLCAHYRGYFKFIGVKTKFYLVFGLNCPIENQVFVKGYNRDFLNAYNKLDQALIENLNINLQLVSNISNYIPGLYFFNAKKYETGAFIKYIMQYFGLDRLSDNEENLIITKDMYLFQLLSKKCKILRPKKVKGIDQSYIISHSNVWDIISREYRKIKPFTDWISPTFISNFYALSSLPERGLTAIKKSSQTYDTLSNMVKRGYLDNNHKYDQASLNMKLAAFGFTNNIGDDVIVNRWKSIDIDYQVYNMIILNPLFNVLHLSEYTDTSGLRHIDSKYYSNCPLDLLRLAQ